MKRAVASALLFAWLVLVTAPIACEVQAQGAGLGPAIIHVNLAPAIDGPTESPTDKSVVFRVKNLPEGVKPKWDIDPPGTQFLTLRDDEGVPQCVLLDPQNGTYYLDVYFWDGKDIQLLEHTLRVGPVVPPVPPVPPGPTPPPPVPPGPVVEGKRQMLIVRESSESTPEISRAINNLRTGENATYLASKGHTLHVLDDDSVDENGKPTQHVEAWRPLFKDKVLPVLFIIDPTTKTKLYGESLPATADAKTVMDLLKGHGG